jgi:NAD(P)-dependent dehydrogenase (short-subunit alcohol dehydrogenase family)
MAGMTCAPGMSVYNVSKHGVVALSETLHHDLASIGSAVKVSVLCPGFVNTRILESARNRPAPLADTAPAHPESAEREALVRGLLATGLPPVQVAACVLEAIRDERFYVFPHPEARQRIRARMEDIAAGRNPQLPSLNVFKRET